MTLCRSCRIHPTTRMLQQVWSCVARSNVQSCRCSIFRTGAVDYEPGAAVWPCAATSPDDTAPPHYRPYQPAALADARTWYSSTNAAAARGQAGAAAAAESEDGATTTAAAAPATLQQPGSAAEPDLIDLGAPDQSMEGGGSATATAGAHDSSDMRQNNAAAQMLPSHEPPNLYVCPITQVDSVPNLWCSASSDLLYVGSTAGCGCLSGLTATAQNCAAVCIALTRILHAFPPCRMQQSGLQVCFEDLVVAVPTGADGRAGDAV